MALDDLTLISWPGPFTSYNIENSVPQTHLYSREVGVSLILLSNVCFACLYGTGYYSLIIICTHLYAHVPLPPVCVCAWIHFKAIKVQSNGFHHDVLMILCFIVLSLCFCSCWSPSRLRQPPFYHIGSTTIQLLTLPSIKTLRPFLLFSQSFF